MEFLLVEEELLSGQAGITAEKGIICEPTV